MPNYCNYQLKAKGDKKNLEKLHRIMNADYRYEKEEVYCSEDTHMFRIFEAALIELNNDYIIIDGYCAWSVFSCMFDSQCTYYRNMHTEYKDKCKATTIDKLSKELKLDIEIFSEESGVGFMEHFLIKQGEIIIDDCVDYYEDYDPETDETHSEGGIEWIYSI